MITGAHAIVFSRDADADRAFFRDVLGLRSVDAGGGWLIFALPAAEVAVHPAGQERQELYLMCDDLQKTVAELRAKGTRVSDHVDELPWGLLTEIELPGGGRLGLYEVRHPTPLGD